MSPLLVAHAPELDGPVGGGLRTSSTEMDRWVSPGSSMVRATERAGWPRARVGHGFEEKPSRSGTDP